MKRNSVLFTSLFVFTLMLPAQTIKIEKRMGELQFFQAGNQLKPKALLTVLESHPESYILAQKANRNLVSSMVVGGIGGVFIGIPVGMALSGADPAWELLGVGAGVSLIAFTFGRRSDKQFRSAVASYNQSLGHLDSRSFQPQYSLISDSDGLGLQIRF